jgi:hypothetical protein
MSLEIQQEKNSYQRYRIFEHLNLHGNQLISSLFLPFWGKILSEFGMLSAETACWGIERK